VDKVLREEYQNLLEAVLSVPLAIMSSVLHDVCATLTFRAASSAARDLQAPPHRWRHHLAVSTSVSRVQACPSNQRGHVILVGKVMLLLHNRTRVLQQKKRKYLDASRLPS
jgi:hypothetical protein